MNPHSHSKLALTYAVFGSTNYSKEWIEIYE